MSSLCVSAGAYSPLCRLQGKKFKTVHFCGRLQQSNSMWGLGALATVHNSEVWIGFGVLYRILHCSIGWCCVVNPLQCMQQYMHALYSLCMASSGPTLLLIACAIQYISLCECMQHACSKLLNQPCFNCMQRMFLYAAVYSTLLFE